MYYTCIGNEKNKEDEIILIFYNTASWKLQEEAGGMKLFLPHGYEIDEDEILNSSMATGETLIMSSTQPKQKIKNEKGKHVT